MTDIHETAIARPVQATPPELPGTKPASRTSGRSILQMVETTGLPAMLAVVFVVFAVLPETAGVFTSTANLRNILSNQSVTGIVALAMIVPLVSGYFDLSTAAIASLANVVTAYFVGSQGLPVWSSIVLALLAGLAVGCVNAFLVAVLELNGFIVTLGSFTLLGGVITFLTGGQTISNGIPAGFVEWGSASLLGIPQPLWLLVVVGVLVWYLLMHTPFGRELEAMGSNEAAARLVGIRVRRNVFLSFCASALLASVAGVLLTLRAGAADPTAGSTYLFPALAAVFLGATAIRPGRYNVWGTLIGVFFVAIGVNGLMLLGADAWVEPVFNGTALILAVFLSTASGRAARAT